MASVMKDVHDVMDTADRFNICITVSDTTLQERPTPWFATMHSCTETQMSSSFENAVGHQNQIRLHGRRISGIVPSWTDYAATSWYQETVRMVKKLQGKLRVPLARRIWRSCTCFHSYSGSH